MNKTRAVFIFLVAISAASGCKKKQGGGTFSPTPVPSPSASPTATPVLYGNLRLHPENPRYFQDVKTGKAVLVASASGMLPNKDYATYINGMIAQHISYGRVWHLLVGGPPETPFPWARSTIPGAAMGGNKYDFDVWDPVYWDYMDKAFKMASEAGVVNEIMLFDRCSMSPAPRWVNNPWASDNNVNNIETPAANLDGTPEFYQIGQRPRLRQYQEAYMKKMIDVTAKYNTVYEIENEHWEHNDPEWFRANARFVKNYLAANHPQHPRLVSYSSLETDLEAVLTTPEVDVLNVHFGDQAEANPDLINQYIESRWSYAKAINMDEYANGLGNYRVLRQMSWTAIMSGGHFHMEEPTDNSNWYSVVENIRNFLLQSQWDFVHAVPKKTFSSGGYCMINRGNEYVCFYPSGGQKVLSDVPAGQYEMKWWNPKTENGGFSGTSTIQHGGGAASVTTPDSADWALHIKKK